MTASVMTEPRFGKSDSMAQKLFSAKDPALEKKLSGFRQNSQWFSKNKEKLRVKYGGKYVAIRDSKVCFAEKDPFELVARVKSKYGDDQSVVVGFLGKERVKFLLWSQRKIDGNFTHQR